MYNQIRPFLFRMNPERAHQMTMALLKEWPGSVRLLAPSFKPSPILSQTLFSKTFVHPIGLAAGLDKDAEAVDGLLRCGFSFVEIGTVTPKPQPGNPRPRLFRLVEDEALINRMGFNNQGAEQVYKNAVKRSLPGILGVNLGKNKVTPNEEALSDYLIGLETFFPIADYIAINVSSPNTPGLRDLQAQETLVPMVSRLLKRRDELWQESQTKISPHRPPILVKIAPDLPNEAIADLARALADIGVDGFIATNTTIERPALMSSAKAETGGLSGAPLRAKSTAVIRTVYRATGGKLPIIGSGGVFSAEDAYEKVLAGARLVQVYTGFIYRGPGIVSEIAQGLAKLVEQNGFHSIEEAVGAHVN